MQLCRAYGTVDQAEELARAEGDSGEALTDYLRAALAAATTWQLAFTTRTDSFPEFQISFAAGSSA
jgi:hypothetical protein